MSRGIGVDVASVQVQTRCEYLEGGDITTRLTSSCNCWLSSGVSFGAVN